jgi:hypothetical protein
MATLEAIVGGTTYNLIDGTYALWIGEDGTGNAPSRRITEQGPLQHGDTDVDVRLDPRIFRELFMITPASLSDHYTRRSALIRIFRPSATKMQMRWTLDNGNIRQIDCVVAGGPDFASTEREGFAQKMVVQLRANDPTFYDPTQNVVTFGVGAGASSFSFPISFPIHFGGSTVDQTRTIAYSGTWRDYPVVIIGGPITDPVVTNLTTADKLDFTGITIDTGDYYIIDCRYGYKTVMDAAGANKIADLSDDSDLATFSLEPDPDAVGGLNDIQVTGSSANANTQIYMRFYNRYTGI